MKSHHWSENRLSLGPGKVVPWCGSQRPPGGRSPSLSRAFSQGSAVGARRGEGIHTLRVSLLLNVSFLSAQPAPLWVPGSAKVSIQAKLGAFSWGYQQAAAGLYGACKLVALGAPSLDAVVNLLATLLNWEELCIKFESRGIIICVGQKWSNMATLSGYCHEN